LLLESQKLHASPMESSEIHKLCACLLFHEAQWLAATRFTVVAQHLSEPQVDKKER